MTNHDAFGYYVDRYQLEFVGSIIPSVRHLGRAVGRADHRPGREDQGDRCEGHLRLESSLPPKTAEAIATQAGVKVVAGEDSLYADTLGPEGSPGATYIDAMTHNTDVIVTALRG